MRGPNLAGGSVFDDFNGDGLPDLFTTSLDADLGASLFINRGDGTFEDRSVRRASVDQVYALNVTRADFDNDGDLDVLLLARGLGEAAAALAPEEQRRRGLRRCDRRQRAGRADRDRSRPPGATTTTTASVDLFVCGEYLPPGSAAVGRPRATAATAAGYITTRATARSMTSPTRRASSTERCAKGSAWGDYDGDGRLDLFVSNMGQPCRLYHNDGRRQVQGRRPRAGRHRRGLQLRLLVLGLRQRRSPRPVRQRLPGPGRRGARQRHGDQDRGLEPSPALPQPRPGRLPRRLARGRARPRHGTDGARTSATSTTTAISTSTWGPATCPMRAWTST